tara:strand:+ start:2443 stop:3210 length:768 start_codon:yes stop_codon:yes gene_type:complete
MLLRYLSDVHLEYRKPSDGLLHLPALSTDCESVLILAGDIGSGVSIIDWMRELSPRFRHILFVTGNHDYWDSDKLELDQQLYKLCSSIPNVDFLNSNAREIGGVEFIGGTLWADFDKENNNTISQAHEIIPDFRRIKIKGHDITPNDMIDEHKGCRDFIFSALKNSQCSKKVVITHYLPSFRSIDPKFYESPLNGYFASSLDQLIEVHQPQLWFHGHTHASCDYNIGSTRVLCNPFGYLHVELNSDYIEKAVIQI